MRSRKVRLSIVTGNPGKLREASSILSEYGVELEQARLDKLEIQSESLEDVALFAARLAFMSLKKPLIVEDAGLFIEALSGFPGPYSSYAYKTIGIGGVLKLMEGVEDRRACFRAAVALVSFMVERVFTGEVCGSISHEPRGTGGFGFDPIFVPEGYDATFAELGDDVKNRISHRARALRSLGEWLAANPEAL